MEANRVRAGRLAAEGDARRVSAEGRNVPVDEAQKLLLVLEAQIDLVEVCEEGRGEEAEGSELSCDELLVTTAMLTRYWLKQMIDVPGS